MSKDKQPEAPEWVKELFKNQKPSSPSATILNRGKDAQMLLFAQREAQLAYSNIGFFTDPEKIRKEKQRLAENLLILGKFKEAYENAQTDELQSRIADIEIAVNEDDEKLCKCEDDYIPSTSIPINRLRLIQRVFSEKHNRMLDVKKCMKCGFLNATEKLTENEQMIKNKLATANSKDNDEKVFQ